MTVGIDCSELPSGLAFSSRAGMSLGAFTASIAHEISQPLSGIMTNAGACIRLLGVDRPDLDAAREALRRILRDGNRACEVIARLRALFSEKATRLERVDLNEAALDVLQSISDELRHNGVVTNAELAEDLPWVVGDRIQLQQVVVNLLRNASDAMSGIEDRPRRLLIKTQRCGDNRVRLSVTDAGVGIDAEIAQRLFQPFVSTKERGMGIGLFMSRFIVERHRGILQVTANDGPGVTFSFTVPESTPEARLRM
jgi:C4-dicarboxylate-specific signal transduction histidine kinase